MQSRNSLISNILTHSSVSLVFSGGCHGESAAEITYGERFSCWGSCRHPNLPRCIYWSKDYALPEWRQHQGNLRRFKAQYRKVQKLRHSTSQDESKKRAKAEQICEAHQVYIDQAQFYLDRVARTVELLKNTHKISGVLLSDFSIFS